jgi:hypothetical protein
VLIAFSVLPPARRWQRTAQLPRLIVTKPDHCCG